MTKPTPKPQGPDPKKYAWNDTDVVITRGVDPAKTAEIFDRAKAGRSRP